MTVGIVLPQPPAYSETFFNSKIKGLQESGFKVIVFSEKNTGKNYFFCHVPAFKIYSNPLIQVFWTSIILFQLFIKAPFRTIRFCSLERKSGTSIKETLKKLFFNAHIIPYPLDWLHCGFATLALKRERLAKVMGAKMAISFRGFDIAIYPVKHPGCYDLLWKNVDKIHTISDDLVRRASEHRLPTDIPVVKITPAIEVSGFPLKEHPGSIHRPIRFLTVGRLHWKKGYEVALEALSGLKSKGFEFEYTIVGDGEERERIIFAIHQLNLEKEVKLIGKVFHSEIVTYYGNEIGRAHV